MKTLQELKDEYARSPKMLHAIEECIKENGIQTSAIIVSGLPSYRKNSNLYRATKALGWNDYKFYYGAHKRYGTEGWSFVVIEK
jgi:hypothetical protein